MPLPVPSATVGIKLACLAVHADEACSPGGNSFDVETMRSLLADHEVAAYMADLNELALLPVKR